MSAAVRICLLSRELAPYGGGGIGIYVANLAALLADVAEVTVVTRADHREAYARLAAAGHPLIDERVTHVFVDEPPPPAVGTYVDFHHAWGAAVLAALERHYGADGPDLLEAPDYYAEAFVPIQAKQSGHATLRDTRIAVRAHCSWELCTLLNGCLDDLPHVKAVCDMERYALQHADAFLWAGGDILGTYRRYYGERAIAAPVRIRHPLEPAPPPPERVRPSRYPLRFLYFGRLERRKGLLDVVTGFMRNPSDAWELTLVGGDTDSAPLRGSMRGQLELMIAGDQRVNILDAQPREALGSLLEETDVVVMPSQWECWPYSVLEALRAGRPVLATPTGGHVEMVAHDRSGWLAAGTTADDLADALDDLLRRPSRVQTLLRSGGPHKQAMALSDPDQIRSAYLELGAAPRPARRRARSAPLVSALVPYRRTPSHLCEAIDSLQQQTHPAMEILLINDGSYDPRDTLLAKLAAQPRVRLINQVNGGLGAARNTGAVHSSGKYLLPLDSDNVAEPTFVERAVEMLESDAAIAYVTCWSRYIDEEGEDLDPGAVTGYQPLGNWSMLIDRLNVAGDAAAVWPRRLWDLGFRYTEEVPVIEDWILWRQMARAGRFGRVIPERLIRYRVRDASMYRTVNEQDIQRLRDEATTRLKLMEMTWLTPSSA